MAGERAILLPFTMRILYFLFLVLIFLLPNSAFSALEIKGTIRESAEELPVAGAILTMDGKTILAETAEDGDYLIWFDRDTVCGKRVWVIHPCYPKTYFFIPWMEEVADEKGNPSKMISREINIELGAQQWAFSLNKRSNPWTRYQKERYKKTDSISVSLEFCPSGHVPHMNEIALGGANVFPTNVSDLKYSATLSLQDIHQAYWIIITPGRQRVEIPLSQTIPFRDHVVKLPPDSIPKPDEFHYFHYPQKPADVVEPPEMGQPMEGVIEDIDGKLDEIERVFNDAFSAKLKHSKIQSPPNFTLLARLHNKHNTLGTIVIYLPDGTILDDSQIKDAVREAWEEVQKSVRFYSPREWCLIFWETPSTKFGFK